MSQTMKRDAREAMPATEPRDAEQAGVVEALYPDWQKLDELKLRTPQYAPGELPYLETLRRTAYWLIDKPQDFDIRHSLQPSYEQSAAAIRDAVEALAASPPPQPTPEAREPGDGWLERLEAVESVMRVGEWPDRATKSVYTDEAGEFDPEFSIQFAADLRIAITRARAADAAEAGWQPIETAPKDGKTVLVCNEVKPGEARPGMYDAWWEDGAWVDGCTDLYDDLTAYHPAYWRPLPAPPALLTGSKQ